MQSISQNVLSLVLTMSSKKSKHITINDLAKMLDTTPATVSRALNDHPRISVKTKERVKALAKKHNYQPNIVASGFRKGKTKSVGILVPFINRHYFSNVIFSIETELMLEDYTSVICQTMDDPEVEEKLISMLINNKVSGIIISSSKDTKTGDALQRAIDKDIKVVQFDNILKDLNTSCIHNDDYRGAKDTVLHLLAMGYRKIALFCGKLNSIIYQERRKGYLDAHKEYGITPNSKLFYEETNTQQEGVEATKKLLASGESFDAIFSTGDYSALGSLLTLKEAGKKIPSEVGIAGFANEPFTALVTPSITSSEQNCHTIGRTAAQQILKEIKNPDENHLITTIQSELLARQSTQKGLDNL